jgi:hypothetical protein
MRKPLLVVVLACSLLMTGCLTLSVYPLYTAKDLVTEPQIEGKWITQEDNEVWEIHKSGDAYMAVCPGDREGEPVDMRIVQLGGQRFLDLTAHDAPSLAVPGHMFGKIAVTGDEMTIQLMTSSWLEKKAREAGLPVLEMADNEILLTAPTAELQKFVVRYAADPDAFEKPTKLKRLRPEPAH